MSSAVALCVFVLGMTQAAVSDLTTMKIRNWLVLFLLGSYSVLAPLAGFSFTDLLSSFVSALIVLLLGFALFSQGWVGGGDVKLASVTVLWLGADHTLSYLVYTALVGGALTIGLIGLRKTLPPPAATTRPWVGRLYSREVGVPYGIALALAALAVVPSTRWAMASI